MSKLTMSKEEKRLLKMSKMTTIIGLDAFGDGSAFE